MVNEYAHNNGFWAKPPLSYCSRSAVSFTSRPVDRAFEIKSLPTVLTVPNKMVRKALIKFRETIKEND